VDQDKRIEGNFVVTVKLRLVRMGKKKQPTYRVVAAESRRARSGAFLEIVGTYQPRGISVANPEMVYSIDNDKVVRWLQQGAQPSERVAKLLKASGALDAFEAAKPVKVTKADEADKADKSDKVAQ
jgi:small subunit ribosomal protein S16